MIFTIIKILFLLLLISALLIFLLNILGIFISRKNSISLTNSYFHSSDKIWNTLNDVIGYPDWNNDAKHVEINQDDNSISWTETTPHNFYITYSKKQQKQSDQLVIVTTDQKLPLDLKRKYTVWRKDYMSFLKVEEELVIKKWHLRLLSKIFFNHKQEIRKHLRSLDSHLDKRYGKI